MPPIRTIAPVAAAIGAGSFAFVALMSTNDAWTWHRSIPDPGTIDESVDFLKAAVHATVSQAGLCAAIAVAFGVAAWWLWVRGARDRK